ncbi:cytochrome c oxidase accessory protein CcoG [Rhodoferax lacus]|uniref:Cytochrome c oxidase accessory protein CcoG n=1 Tax=Rhodoferax lacus TaxID=2184758 RepID=A0A3E1RD90_9BURK|nr:cytochrome c oxidase accessory protein CcoG [Rhodoferax lacus]RFO97337.1 cytochrome c oxidase accessory protein CcoG [Rhodoferax lacus]
MELKPVPRRVIPIQVQAADAQGMVSLYEKTPKVYPRSVAGWFARWRWAMVWLTQLVFYGLPWLQWNGRQAVLFDLAERRFFVFGLVLHPQDFIYLAALLILAALLLFFVTAIAGRVWCGYACPQTVYTEIFMWVERHTEGDRQARMRLDAAAWGPQKLARKSAKQGAWIALALLTGLSFVGYFTPMRELGGALLLWALSPWQWFWVLFYAFATYGNAGFMREQVCKTMCPYARFQSALIDMDSLVIAYDADRGEARGGRARSADPKALGLGDCIDCTLCVQVCPTGIDIRNGLQNECIACAACIDVCDQVMLKMDYAPGLIRYSSGNGMEQQLNSRQLAQRVGRPRVWIYGALLLLVGSAFVLSLSTRKGFSVDVMKDRGTLAREVERGAIENVYRLQVMNAREQAQHFTASVQGPPGLRVVTDPQLTVEATGIASLTVRLNLPPEQAKAVRGQTLPIHFRVQTEVDGQVLSTEEKSTFYVPR